LDSELGTAAAEFRGKVTLEEIRRAAGNLDRTFVLRLFAEFEGILTIDQCLNGFGKFLAFLPQRW
jgi:hypothetical protein